MNAVLLEVQVMARLDAAGVGTVDNGGRVTGRRRHETVSEGND